MSSSFPWAPAYNSQTPADQNAVQTNCASGGARRAASASRFNY